jgi:hypothetical protein
LGGKEQKAGSPNSELIKFIWLGGKKGEATSFDPVNLLSGIVGINGFSGDEVPLLELFNFASAIAA